MDCARFRPVTGLLAATILLACVTSVAGAAEGRPIGELLDETGAVLEWDDFSRTGMIWKGLDSIGFMPGEGVAVADFDELMRIEPIVYELGRLYVPDQTFDMLVQRLGRAGPAPRLRPVKAIVIDAGHGGRDPGTNRTVTVDGESVMYMEKDIVLDMARRIRDELGPLVDGPEIVLTRDTDVFLELAERTEIANNQRTDPLENILFISLHVNASVAPWTQSRGVEIYYLPSTQRRQVLEASVTASLEPEVSAILNNLKEEEYTVESVLMGRAVLEAIASYVPDTPIERGIRVANFHVVREARMPSILIETGFINNREDLALLTTPEYRQRMAEGIARGIATYVEDFERLQ